MNPKYKIGDKVKITKIDLCFSQMLNTTQEIVDIIYYYSSGNYYYRLNNINSRILMYDFSEDQLELVEEEHT